MSLPFLVQAQKMAGSIMERRKKDGSVEHSEHPPEVLSAAEDAIKHFHAKNPHGVATSLKNLMDLFNSAPGHDGADGQE